MLLLSFPDVEAGISWEGHLGGFLTGLLFSRLFNTPDYKSPVIYDWQKPDFDPQQDPFMKRFDENGNFVNPPKPEPEEDDEVQPSQTKTFPVIKIVYSYKPQQKEEGSGEEEESNKK